MDSPVKWTPMDSGGVGVVEEAMPRSTRKIGFGVHFSWFSRAIPGQTWLFAGVKPQLC